MDISSYIVSLSMSMSHAASAQAANVSVLKMAMDTQGNEANVLAEMMQTPSFGHMLDIRA